MPPYLSMGIRYNSNIKASIYSYQNKNGGNIEMILKIIAIIFPGNLQLST